MADYGQKGRMVHKLTEVCRTGLGYLRFMIAMLGHINASEVCCTRHRRHLCHLNYIRLLRRLFHFRASHHHVNFYDLGDRRCPHRGSGGLLGLPGSKRHGRRWIIYLGECHQSASSARA